MTKMEKQPPEASVRKIRAAVLHKRGGPLKIESGEREGPRDDELLVRLVASGICRRDIGLVDDWDNSGEPVVLGHEGAGGLEEVGRRVKGIAPGDPRRALLQGRSATASGTDQRDAEMGHAAGRDWMVLRSMMQEESIQCR